MMYLKLVQIIAFQGILYLNSIIVENFNVFKEQQWKGKYKYLITEVVSLKEMYNVQVRS